MNEQISFNDSVTVAKHSFRTDRNNNPAAFTTDIAKEAGLILNEDYTAGEPFPPPSSLVTAKLLKDPIDTTIKVINKIGFRTSAGVARWAYINMPYFVWDCLPTPTKQMVIEDMYHHEGGTELLKLFYRASLIENNE